MPIKDKLIRNAPTIGAATLGGLQGAAGWLDDTGPNGKKRTKGQRATRAVVGGLMGGLTGHVAGSAVKFVGQARGYGLAPSKSLRSTATEKIKKRMKKTGLTVHEGGVAGIATKPKNPPKLTAIPGGKEKKSAMLRGFFDELDLINEN